MTWDDDEFQGPEAPVDEWDAAEKLVRRDINLDRGLSRYGELMAKHNDLREQVRAFDRLVARRFLQITVAKVYPDPHAPVKLREGAAPSKVTRTDAQSIAEAEVLAEWPGPDPRSMLEQVRSNVHHVQYAIKARSAQLSAAQTAVKYPSHVIHGAGRVD